MPTCTIEALAAKLRETRRDELYVAFDGKRIVKRGYPGSPQAGVWEAIEPGFNVAMNGDALVVTKDGKPVPVH